MSVSLISTKFHIPHTRMYGGQNVKIGGGIITSIDGQPLTSIEELKAALSQLKSDQEVSLTLLRDGKQIQVTVIPGK